MNYRNNPDPPPDDLVEKIQKRLNEELDKKEGK